MTAESIVTIVVSVLSVIGGIFGVWNGVLARIEKVKTDLHTSYGTKIEKLEKENDDQDKVIQDLVTKTSVMEAKSISENKSIKSDLTELKQSVKDLSAALKDNPGLIKSAMKQVVKSDMKAIIHAELRELKDELNK